MATSLPSAVDVTVTMAPNIDVTDEQLEEAAFDVLDALYAHPHASGPVASVSFAPRGIRIVFTLDDAHTQEEVHRQTEDIVGAVRAAVEVEPVTNPTAKHEVALCDHAEA